MSAVMQPARARVELAPTKELPRKLLIGWDSDGCSVHIHAHAFIHGGSVMRSVAFGGAHAVSEVHLDYTSGVPVLWLRSAQFELTAAEAVEVERVFAPLGLHIVRDGAQS